MILFIICKGGDDVFPNISGDGLPLSYCSQYSRREMMLHPISKGVYPIYDFVHNIQGGDGVTTNITEGVHPP